MANSTLLDPLLSLLRVFVVTIASPSHVLEVPSLKDSYVHHVLKE